MHLPDPTQGCAIMHLGLPAGNHLRRMCVAGVPPLPGQFLTTHIFPRKEKEENGSENQMSPCGAVWYYASLHLHLPVFIDFYF